MRRAVGSSQDLFFAVSWLRIRRAWRSTESAMVMLLGLADGWVRVVSNWYAVFVHRSQFETALNASSTTVFGDNSMQNGSPFNPFAPGFDFLKKLTEGNSGPASAQFPQWNDWIAPTMNVQDLDKRIGELKTVQFWLEQNQRALAATIQAMEVQKMTLSALQTMNVPVENWAATVVEGWQNLASSSAGTSTPFAAKADPVPEPQPVEPPVAAPSPAAGATAAAGADPLQWWGALTQQFQQIANQAVQDVSQLAAQHAAATQQVAETAAKVMGAATAAKPRAPKAATAAKKPAAAAKRAAPSKKPAAKKTTSRR